ncbi:MAG: prolipoprotein diacylglyceryl transferase [Verrucomicrobia subdivision 3 bacterium]|nr:prolipoprotein diacylglyceryl transferase [Verrucomicrobiota bacterium]MCC6823779.1 prolipoprotein diacylglyceryl transferase [Limisphaerales bacterium]
MHPIAFHLGPLTVHWFGICIALAFLAGLWTATRRAPRAGIPGEQIADLVVPWLLLGGILGARVLYIATYWRESFAGQPWSELFMIQRGGLVYYGGLTGASLAVILFARWKRIPLWKLADVLTPSIALGSMFGRIGCLMNGCCFGRSCELPWAIRFPDDHSTQGLPVHPTQIYDALLNLTLYLGLAWLYRRRTFDGQVFAVYLLGYAVTRSIVEAFRGDYNDGHLHGGFTPAHLVSVASLAAGMVLFLVLRRRKSATAPAK